MRWETVKVATHDAQSLAEGALIICLSRKLDLEAFRAIADREPQRVVLPRRRVRWQRPAQGNAVQILSRRNIVFRRVACSSSVRRPINSINSMPSPRSPILRLEDLDRVGLSWSLASRPFESRRRAGVRRSADRAKGLRDPAVRERQMISAPRRDSERRAFDFHSSPAHVGGKPPSIGSEKEVFVGWPEKMMLMER